jgi:hypothetical protein
LDYIYSVVLSHFHVLLSSKNFRRSLEALQLMRWFNIESVSLFFVPLCSLDGGITATLQNQLDGVVPRWNGYNLDDEIAASFEMLPTKSNEALGVCTDICLLRSMAHEEFGNVLNSSTLENHNHLEVDDTQAPYIG